MILDLPKFNWDSATFKQCSLGDYENGPMAMVIDCINEKRRVTRQPPFKFAHYGPQTANRQTAIPSVLYDQNGNLTNSTDGNSNLLSPPNTNRQIDIGLAWSEIQQEVVRLTQWFFWRKPTPEDAINPLYFVNGINPGQTIGNPNIVLGIRPILPLQYHPFVIGSPDNNNEPMFRRFKPRTIYTLSQKPKNPNAKYARFEAQLNVPIFKANGYSDLNEFNNISPLNTQPGTPIAEYTNSGFMFEWNSSKQIWEKATDQTVEPDLITGKLGWCRTGDFIDDWIIIDCIYLLNLMTQIYYVDTGIFGAFGNASLQTFNSFDVSHKVSIFSGFGGVTLDDAIQPDSIDTAINLAEQDYKLTFTSNTLIDRSNLTSTGFAIQSINVINYFGPSDDGFPAIQAKDQKTIYTLQIHDAPLLNKKTEYSYKVAGLNDTQTPRFKPSLMNDSFGWDDTDYQDYVNKTGNYAYLRLPKNKDKSSFYIGSYNIIQFDHFDSNFFESDPIGNKALYPVWNRDWDARFGEVISAAGEIINNELLGWEIIGDYIIMDLDVDGGLKYRKGTHATL